MFITLEIVSKLVARRAKRATREEVLCCVVFCCVVCCRIPVFRSSHNLTFASLFQGPIVVEEEHHSCRDELKPHAHNHDVLQVQQLPVIPPIHEKHDGDQRAHARREHVAHEEVQVVRGPGPLGCGVRVEGLSTGPDERNVSAPAKGGGAFVGDW